MTKPIIGITCDLYRSESDGAYGPQYSLRFNYCEMIRRAGGVPVILPTNTDMSALAPLLDGVLVPGGRDIDPKHFGQEPHPASEMQDPSRFAAESALYEALPKDAPVLGICYGAQFLNVKHGGTLHQHLPDQLQHREHEGGTHQRYQVEADSQLGAIVQLHEVEGKSYHHQAIDRLGEGLRVVARHEDGTVEAIEGEGPRWLIGVQWHPERTPDLPETQRLFDAFIAAARTYREARNS